MVAEEVKLLKTLVSDLEKELKTKGLKAWAVNISYKYVSSEWELCAGGRGADAAAEADQEGRPDPQAGEGAPQTQGKR